MIGPTEPFEQVGLDAVLITDELYRRPARPPDRAAEADALAELAQTLAEAPHATLRKLVDLVLKLCHADSAGVSIQDTGSGVFRWPAIAGAWITHSGSLPKDASPCGIVIDRNTPLLFSNPSRHFPDVAAVAPPLLESLLVPFHVDDRAVGTVWANAHTPDRKFDAEDLRLLTVLSRVAAGHQRAGTRRHEAEERYLALFNAIDQGFCTLEVRFEGGKPVDYRFLEVSPSFERQTGITNAPGRWMREIAPNHDEHWFEIYGRIARTGNPERFENHSTPLGRWWDVYAFRIQDPAQRRVAVLFTDVTARKRAEAALRASAERLELALAAARMGIWTLDAMTGTQMRDANLNVLLGLEPAETVQPFEEFLTHVHPEDRETVRTAFAASIRERKPLNVEFRVVRPDGAARWLRDQGDVFHTSGFPQMAGACMDVTERREAEEALRRSEERVRLILSSATDFAIFTLDPNRVVTDWSPGAGAIFGYAASEIVGRSGDVLFTPEDRAAGAPAAEAETARRNGRAEDERWHLRKNGSRFYASGVMTPLRDAGTGFVKVARDLTERKRMEDELRDARDRLEMRVAERTAELAAALESLEGEIARRSDHTRRLATVQEDERRRVARDLHDSVGQLLAGLSLAFKAVTSAGDLPPASAIRLAEAQRVADALGKEVHGLAVRLRPTSLDDIGLEAALGQLVAEWSERTGVRADLHAAGLGAGRLAPEIETTLYRVVQEALTNVAKHARATNVSVVVTRPDGYATATIEDDGVGFDPDAVPKGRLGLLGMRERVALVGGEMDVESAPGSGTTVGVRVPVSVEGSGS